MRKSNLYKKLIVVANIISIILLILVLVNPNKTTYSFYWIGTPFVIIPVLLLIREIDKGSMDSDLSKSKLIKRSYNDITTVSVMFYGIIYLIIELVDILKDNFKYNNYIIIIFYVITILYQFFVYLAVINAVKETRELLEKKK